MNWSTLQCEYAVKIKLLQISTNHPLKEVKMSWAQQFERVMVNRCISMLKNKCKKTKRNIKIVCSVWGQPWPSRRGRPPRISPGVKSSQHIIRHHLPIHLNPVFRTPQCQRAQPAPPLPQPSSGSITKGLPKVLKDDKTDNQVGRGSLHLEVRQSFEREEGWGQDPVQGCAWRHLQGRINLTLLEKWTHKFGFAENIFWFRAKVWGMSW